MTARTVDLAQPFLLAYYRTRDLKRASVTLPRTYSALPDDGLSEYLVQYTHAGHSNGWLSLEGCAPPLLAFPAVTDVGFSVLVPLASAVFDDEVCLEVGDEDEEDDEEEVVLSLLQFES